MSINFCLSCLTIPDVPNCPQTLIIPTDYSAQAVTVWVEDKHGNQYNLTETIDYGGTSTIGVFTDYDGTITFDYPNGINLFNEWSGTFRLWIEDSSNDILPFTYNSVSYDCLQFDIVRVLPDDSTRSVTLKIEQK